MKLGIAEILRKADEAKSKEDKVQILKDNASSVLVDVLRLFYDKPRWDWMLNEKTYNWRPAPYLDMHAGLMMQIKKVPRFFLDPPLQALTPEKRTQLWIQFLESLDANDAKLMESIRTKKFPYKTVTRDIVKTAFGDLIVDDRNADLHDKG